MSPRPVAESHLIATLSALRPSRRRLMQGAAAVALAPALRKARGATAPGQPLRQIHLDFHTSGLIKDVGKDFDAGRFAATLREAHVDSVNVFAKCHHGFAYYDTEIAHRHPALKIDLLGQMVKALHGAGIRANYYYSLVWDVRVADLHPEWRQRDAAGKPIGDEPSVVWPWLCMNSPYLDQVVRENEEILSRIPVDGAWFDILKTPPEGCHCRHCIADRRKLGIANDKDGFYRHGKLVARRTQERLFSLVRKHRPNGGVFFNSRLVIGVRDEMPFYSHVEIESLPTGGWGYTHFQQRARYLRNLGHDAVGMTGRFHKAWGDFGGLKNQAALDFECLNFVANGCAASVGDQLHPRGALDPLTYRRIGATYARLGALEPWIKGARPVADIGVLSSAAVDLDLTTTKVPPADQGFTNMLVELHHQFDVLDLESDFLPYRVIILPDVIPPSPALVAKLRVFLARGGRLLTSHTSLLDTKAGAFALDEMGLDDGGPSHFRDEFMIVPEGSMPQIEPGAYFLYQRGRRIKARPGTEVLATYGHPYFDRGPEHFLSHKQTPLDVATSEPLVTCTANTAHVAHPIFTSYAQDAYGVSKQVIAHLLGRLLPDPLLRTAGLPSTAQATVLRQSEERERAIVHLLHYPLTRRAPDIDIIEEPGTLVDVRLEVRSARRPRHVELVPQRRPLRFRHRDGYVHVTVPRVVGHQALAISWA